MRLQGYLPVPANPTIEEARRFVTSRDIVIGVSSTAVVERKPDGTSRRGVQVQNVVITKESEMKSELVLHGPTRRGEVNSYLGIDARRHYFDAKTGQAIGSNMRPLLIEPYADPLPRLR